MPSFEKDLSQLAIDYVRESIKDMPGNPGQEALLQDLKVDCYCIGTVEISGQDVDVSVEGNIKFYSNHPEAIEIIIKAGEDNFEEFKEVIMKPTFRNRFIGFVGLNDSNVLESLREDIIDEAFRSL